MKIKGNKSRYNQNKGKNRIKQNQNYAEKAGVRSGIQTNMGWKYGNSTTICILGIF